MQFSRKCSARSLTISHSICYGGSYPTPLDVDTLVAGPPDADPPPWTEGMTLACENITLSQTSFVGGKNIMNRVFSKCTRVTIMPILATEALLCENNPVMLPPVGIET